MNHKLVFVHVMHINSPIILTIHILINTLIIIIALLFYFNILNIMEC